MPNTSSPIPFSTTLLDHLPPGAHPLLLYATAAATILLSLGTLLLAALILAALTRRLAQALRRPSFTPPRPLLAPWERHALAALRTHLPAEWSVLPHVNPLALLPNHPPPAVAGQTFMRGARTPSTGPYAQHDTYLAATIHAIPFAVIAPDHVPRAVIAVKALKPTRTTRRQDAALTTLLAQYGIATHFVTPGTRPDWKAITASITTPPKPRPRSIILGPTAEALLTALRAATNAGTFRRPDPDTAVNSPTRTVNVGDRLRGAIHAATRRFSR